MSKHTCTYATASRRISIPIPSFSGNCSERCTQERKKRRKKEFFYFFLWYSGGQNPSESWFKETLNSI